tara:strand:+ start:354 stop:815 length:462 start_codon:yes stop_codon:yes gene_type:complete
MDINAEISDMRLALASLEAKAKALETPKQWEPRGGDWSIRSNGQVDLLHGNRGLLHQQFGEMRLNHGAAKKASDAMRTHNRLLAYVDEFGGDWEADWEDKKQEKYFVFYSHYHINGEWCSDSTRGCNATGAVHMSQDCAVELANKLNSGEVVL